MQKYNLFTILILIFIYMMHNNVLMLNYFNFSHLITKLKLFEAKTFVMNVNQEIFNDPKDFMMYWKMNVFEILDGFIFCINIDTKLENFFLP